MTVEDVREERRKMAQKSMTEVDRLHEKGILDDEDVDAVKVLLSSGNFDAAAAYVAVRRRQEDIGDTPARITLGILAGIVTALAVALAIEAGSLALVGFLLTFVAASWALSRIVPRD